MYHHVLPVTQCQNDSAPLGLSVSSASVSGLLLAITIPTNLLVCLAILIDPNKELRTHFNCFTFNLALADLLVGCMTEPVAVYAHVTEALDTEHKQKVKTTVLRLFHIPYFISAMASVLSIAALAVERYLAVTLPLRYRQYFNVRLTIILSTAIWFIAISFGLLNLYIDYIKESFIFVNTGVLFTGGIVCFACFKMRSTIREVSSKWSNLGVQNKSEGDIQIKLTRTFSLIIAALMCCYVPACTMIYFMTLCHVCHCDLIQWFRDVSFWFVLLNSAVNPFVYAMRNSSFRNAIREILSCRSRCHYTKHEPYSAKFAKKPGKALIDRSGHVQYGSLGTATTSTTTTGEVSTSGLERA